MDSSPDGHPQSPHVKGGIARQAQLRRQLGDDGYRQLQRQHAQASIAAQIAAGTYTANRRAGYDAVVTRYGAGYAQALVTRASETRRLWRLDHPTAGEQVLRTALTALGYDLVLTLRPFQYTTWRDETDLFYCDLTLRHAVVEAGVDRYAVDVLLPHARVAIEFLGGIHHLSPDADQRRRLALEQHGLTVIELHEEDLPHLETILHTRLSECLALLPARAMTLQR